jgi:MFS family permease
MSELTVDAPSPDAPPTPETGARLHVVIAALMLSLLLAALDSTIVATALPTIVGDLGGLDQYSWVVTAYLLTFTVSTPLYGKLGDLYGRKRLFQAAIVIFLVGSALSGQSRNMTELIIFRGLQGIGGGGLMVGSGAATRATSGRCSGSPAWPGRWSAGSSPTTSTGAGCSTSTSRSGSSP